MLEHVGSDGKLINQDVAYDVQQFVKLVDSQNDSTLLLPVMIETGPYAEDQESRLRSRYAVLSTLASEGYYPRFGKKLNILFIKNFPEVVGVDTTENNPLYIPFDVLVSDSLQSRRYHFPSIAVLWLDDSRFAQNTLKSLSSLYKSFPADARVVIRIIGPRSSDTLKGLWKKSKVDKRDRKDMPTLYSPWATAPSTLVQQSLGDDYIGPLAAVHRTVINDYHTLQALVNELDKHRRVRLLCDFRMPSGVDSSYQSMLHDTKSDPDQADSTSENAPGNDSTELGPAHRDGEYIFLDTSETIKEQIILLISEWDTFYGRAMPMAFAAACLNSGSLRDRLGTVKKQWPSHIHRYSYLRGIDGAVPPSKNSTDQSAHLAGDTSAEGKDGHEERRRPEGKSQYDYVRELAERLRREYCSARSETTIAAIGILGSDIYDKLLILQALRPVFPGAIFFTTDLDARLFHPRELDWSRNLLVASSSDLWSESDQPRQGRTGIPPFRDGYMKAMQVACQAALKGDPPKADTLAVIFEIGRTGPVRLLTESELEDGVSSPGFDISPDLPKWIGVFAIFLLIAFVFSTRLKGDFDELSTRKGVWIRKRVLDIFFYSLFVVSIICLIQLVIRGSVEPFLMFEGISIWPTEFVRIGAALLSLRLLIRVACAARDSDEELLKRFDLDGRRRERSVDLRRRVKEFLKMLKAAREERDWNLWQRLRRWVHYEWLGVQDPVVVKLLYAEYLIRGKTRHRLGRAMLMYFGYIVLISLATDTLLLHPPPARGETAFNIVVCSYFLSFSMLGILTFLVVDATLLCCHFVRALTKEQSEWTGLRPTKAYEVEGLDSKVLANWWDTHLVAQLTSVTQKFILYPFLVVSLLILARNPFFDRWTWPSFMSFYVGFPLLVALLCAVILQREARRARGEALARLRAQRISAESLEGKNSPSSAIKTIIDDVVTLREGAFMPLVQHPIFGALALPFGGVSLAVLLEYLSRL
jgi:hypothetical protein